jgi:mono/diheme cytochrome c family protein
MDPRRVLAHTAVRAFLAMVMPLAPHHVHAQATNDGESAFLKNCAYCHLGQAIGYQHAPRLAQLKQFPPERIHEALVNGRMRPNTRFMSRSDIEAVIRYITAPPAAAASGTTDAR